MPIVSVPPACLIATLGSEPQVVTAALHLLQQQGEALAAVQVIHSTPDTDASPIAAALAHLQAEFAAAPDLPPLDLIPIVDAQGRPLADLDTPEASPAVFSALYAAVRAHKRAGERVHLCIAGGRKTMAIFGMLAAQLLFDDDDRLWHLFSAGAFLAERRMFPQPGDAVQLVAIPVIQWSATAPILLPLAELDDPFAALAQQQALRLDERIQQQRAFVLGVLTGAEARVVALLVREGLNDAAIAERLFLSDRTVESHLLHAYRKAALHWDLAAVNRTQLVNLLSLYYQTQVLP
jgi:CRISPR-associated Csx14 family protein